MRLTIYTKDFKATDSLIDFVRDRVALLDDFSNRIREGKVLLRIDSSYEKDNRVCEIKVVIRGDELLASRRSGTFREAVLETVSASQRQIERWKKMSAENY